MKTDDGRLWIVSGASRSGKTAKTLRLARESKTCFVWDIEGQWFRTRGFKRVNSLAELSVIAKAGRQGRWCYVATGNIKAEFDFFCRAAFHYGSFYGPCAVVAEELADVTTTAKAPDGWGILLRRGLKRGITIYAISQRWAEADKTAIGNASDFLLFRMASGDDIAYMARKTRIEAARLEGLKPLEYIHYNAITGEITGSKLTF